MKIKWSVPFREMTIPFSAKNHYFWNEHKHILIVENSERWYSVVHHQLRCVRCSRVFFWNRPIHER